MWAGFLIQGSIKDVKGLEIIRNTLSYFWFSEFNAFPTIIGREDEVTNTICPYRFYVNTGFVNRRSYTSDLQEAALLLGCKGAELPKVVHWLCHCFISIFHMFSDSYAKWVF